MASVNPQVCRQNANAEGVPHVHCIKDDMRLVIGLPMPLNPKGPVRPQVDVHGEELLDYYHEERSRTETAGDEKPHQRVPATDRACS